MKSLRIRYSIEVSSMEIPSFIRTQASVSRDRSRTVRIEGPEDISAFAREKRRKHASTRAMTSKPSKGLAM